MAKKIDYTFTSGGKIHYLINDPKSGKSSSFTSYDMSTKNRNVRVIRKMGVDKNYNIFEEDMEYNPILSEDIKGNNIFI